MSKALDIIKIGLLFGLISFTTSEYAYAQGSNVATLSDDSISDPDQDDDSDLEDPSDDENICEVLLLGSGASQKELWLTYEGTLQDEDSASVGREVDESEHDAVRATGTTFRVRDTAKRTTYTASKSGLSKSKVVTDPDARTFIVDDASDKSKNGMYFVDGDFVVYKVNFAITEVETSVKRKKAKVKKVAAISLDQVGELSTDTCLE